MYHMATEFELGKEMDYWRQLKKPKNDTDL